MFSLEHRLWNELLNCYTLLLIHTCQLLWIIPQHFDQLGHCCAGQCNANVHTPSPQPISSLGPGVGYDQQKLRCVCVHCNNKSQFPHNNLSLWHLYGGGGEIGKSSTFQPAAAKLFRVNSVAYWVGTAPHQHGARVVLQCGVDSAQAAQAFFFKTPGSGGPKTQFLAIFEQFFQKILAQISANFRSNAAKMFGWTQQSRAG